TEEGEFRTIYSLDVVEIPTNRPVRRKDMPDKIFSTEEGKKRAIVREIVERHEKGQPILVGTVSVEKSEEISRLLRRNGIQHNILNAKNHEREAEIVAQAGRFNAVTISTNMAGRGTDILLGGNPEYLAKKRLREEGVDHETIELATSYAELDEATQAVRDRYDHLYKTYKAQTDEEKKKVIEAGGLCIIGTERHEARRIDNQLRGRAGRQGDEGVSVFFISLEDDLMKRFGGERMKAIYEKSKMEEDECLEANVLSRLVEYAQKQIEGRHFAARKSVLQYDDVMNQQRIIMYGQRMKVLRGENVHEQVIKYIPDYAESTVRTAVNTDVEPSKWNVDDLNRALEQRLLPEGTNYVTQEKLEKWDYDVAIKQITKRTEKAYEEKIADLQKETGINFGDVERQILLRNVDRNWIDHIDAMDQLRKGIVLRAYGQTDPVIAYKQEGSAMFNEMIERIQTNTVAMLLKVRIEVRQRPTTRVLPTASRFTPRPQPAAENAPAAEAQRPAANEAPAQAPVQNAPSAPAQSAAPAAPHLPGLDAAGIPDLPPAVDVDSLKTSGESKFNPASMPKRKKIGPNDPCPCGSGLKYKKCHGKP
ncbi:MAG TPA: SEC-C domain-containing protein, partial [Candidatus Gallimonas intestinavium]|nr:SEC-C domain-containing protein [Candidatus Gallimonas intestinavium]